MIRRRPLVAALVGLLLAACGSGGATPSPSPTTSPAPSVEATPAAPPSAAPPSSAEPTSAPAGSPSAPPTPAPSADRTSAPQTTPAASPTPASPTPATSPVPLAQGRLEPAADDAWGRLAAGIARDGTVPLDTALGAFALVFGPLPGVEAPSGDGPQMSSGSAAVRWLVGHWDELTPEQQAGATELLGVAGGGATNVGDRLDPGLVASLGSFPGLVDGIRVAQAAPSCAVEPSDPKVGPLREVLAAVGPTLAEKLKRELKLPVVFALGNVQGRTGIAADTVPMGADCQPATGRPAYCRIQVTERGQGLEGFELRHVVAHELFHCHQYDFATSAAAAGRVAPWLAEGAAAWVGEVIAGGSTVGEEYWTPWLMEPQRPLFTHDYGGIGFFMHLADSGVDPWPLLVPMHLKGESSSADAYAVAVKAKGAPRMIDAWGPSFMQDNSGGGNDWRTNGPGLPLGIQPPSSQEALGSTDSYILSVGPQAGWAARFDVQSDVVVLEGRSSRGLVRFADGSQRALADVLGKPLCVKAGGCSCPNGSAGAAHQWLTAAPGTMLVGVSGHTDGAHVIVDGFDVDTTCEHKPDDFKPQEPCFCPPGALGGLAPAMTVMSGSLRRLPRGRGPRPAPAS